MSQRNPIFTGVDLAAGPNADQSAVAVRQGTKLLMMVTDEGCDIDRDWIDGLCASRKADREQLAMAFRTIGSARGATVEQQHRNGTPGYCGHGIHLRFACKGVGAMVDISDLHGGEWVLIHWYNDTHPARDFTTRFNVAVSSGGNGRPHHKATSHPRDWSSLANMLDGGLRIAARGEAFEEHSAT
ncbi:MAG: hypothetical protein ACJ8HI_07190 [Massilia sp.]|jgi:hypothetical protein